MMNIPKNLADKIENSIKQVLDHEEKNIELEAVYSGKEIVEKQFKYLMKHCRKNEVFFKETQNSTLDISHNLIRATIEGNDNISEFCRSKGKTFPENVEIIEKSRMKKKEAIKIDKLGFKLNMKSETKLPNAEIKKILKNKEATFRLKKRYSFQATSFRIDMTIVRQYTSDSEEFSDRYLWSAKPKNEVEIEFLPPPNSKCSDIDCSQLTKDFLNLMHTVSCVFNSVTNKNSEDLNVIKGYKKLLKKDLDKLKQSNRRFANSESKIDQIEFLSYKPVTLQVSNLDKKCKGVPGNILQNYAVTEKSDGDRMLLFIYESKVYLLNDQRKIIFTGIENQKLDKFNNSLIDV